MHVHYAHPHSPQLVGFQLSPFLVYVTETNWSSNWQLVYKIARNMKVLVWINKCSRFVFLNA